jgi:hypothetical protein
MYLVIVDGKVFAIESVEPPDGAYGQGEIKEWFGEPPKLGDPDPTIGTVGKVGALQAAINMVKSLNGKDVRDLTTNELKLLLLACAIKNGWIDGNLTIRLR